MSELLQNILTFSDNLLQEFVQRTEALYGTTAMTFNIHQLLHLTESAKNLGPLWAHSTFVFESGNGEVVKCITAAKGAADQVLERVVIRQEVDILLKMLNLSQQTNQICQSMLGYKRLNSCLYEEKACLLGTPRQVTSFRQAEEDALKSTCGICPSRAYEYHRFILNGTVHHSDAYKRASKSDSSAFVSTSGEYFKIVRILRVQIREEIKCLLLCKEIVVESAEPSLPHHIKQCFVSPLSTLNVFSLSDISQVCVMFRFADLEKSYVCNLPNLIERD